MTTQLDEDRYLTIQLLSFNRPDELSEEFYFLEMSTLQATTLLAQDKKILSTKITAYTDDNKHLDESTRLSFKTIRNFNDFFIQNSDYYIQDCDIELESGMNLTSHDDGEVSIQFSSDNSDKLLIDNIFEKYNLDKKLVNTIKEKPGHYFAIDKNSNVRATFIDFDDYIENGRNK